MSKHGEDGYTSIRLPDTVPGIGYTLKHRNCVERIIKYYCKRAIGKTDGNGVLFTKDDYKIMQNRGKCHDMDKLVTSLAYPQLTADYLHRMFQGHHEESFIEPDKKNKYDWIEMICDMESAKYTKKDKQGSGAYSYASKCKPHVFNYMLPYFQLLGLNKEDTGIVEEIKIAVNRSYYEADLIEAILNYIHTTHIHLLDGVSRLDDEGYMRKFNQPVPFRRNSFGNGSTYYNRPNNVAQCSNKIMNLEMVHGSFSAQLFDYDALCRLPVSELRGVNNTALSRLKIMGRDFQR